MVGSGTARRVYRLSAAGRLRVRGGLLLAGGGGPRGPPPGADRGRAATDTTRSTADPHQGRTQHVEPDDDLGQAHEVLDVADDALERDTAEQLQERPARGGRRLDGAQREPQGDGQADDDVDEVDVELGDLLPVQRDAVDLLGVARVRAGARDDRADDGERAGRGDQQPGQLPRRTGDQVARLLVALARPLPAQHGDREQRRGRQEVRADDVRVQAGEDRDAADDGVAHDEPELRPAEPGERAAPGVTGAGGDDEQADRPRTARTSACGCRTR